MPRPTRPPDAEGRLRRDVRLLGQILGRVLVEQEGEELLEAVERIRLLSRAAREGRDPSQRAELGESVRLLDDDRRANVLRAFGIYFQLANLAEQHHRQRRWREARRAGRAPRESLAAAFEQLEATHVPENTVR
jgi:phosphoenolpyruvate carboxylase